MSKSGTVDKKATVATLTTTTTDPVVTETTPVVTPAPAPVSTPAPAVDATTTLLDAPAPAADTGGTTLPLPAPAEAAAPAEAPAAAPAEAAVPAPVDPVVVDAVTFVTPTVSIDTASSSSSSSSSDSASPSPAPAPIPSPFTVVTDAQTALDALLGSASGIEVQSVTLKAADGAVSLYNGGLSALSIGAGLLLTSGSATPGTVNDMTGYGLDKMTDGDADLTQIVQSTYADAAFNKMTYDAAALEFSFIVTDPAARSVSFDLVFGSEEFPEYVDSYVDIAAVVINGVNVAHFNHDPANPLSVVSQNVAAGYFIDNAAGQLSIQYDGVSRLLHVVAPIETMQGYVNTIKIAIADTGDHILDSGIFVANFRASDDPGYGVTASDHTGTASADDLTGGTQAEYFDLQLGDDSLNAGAGDDIVVAGAGDDSILGGAGDDAINGGAGDDSARFHGLSSNFVITQLANGDVQVVDLTGAEGTDVLSGVEKLNFDDVTVDLATYFVAAAPAALTVVEPLVQAVETPAAPVVETPAAPVVETPAAPVVETPVAPVAETPVAPVVETPAPAAPIVVANLNLVGTAAADQLAGAAGNDTIDGGLGADTMTGGAGNDSYVVDDRKDSVVEAADGGTDTVFASTDHTLTAHVENLVLTGTGSIDGLGNALNNMLTGNAGKNALNGGAGNDAINGGAGTDLLTGGAGNDTFVFAAVTDSSADAKKADAITDFAGGDYIDLQLIDAISGTAVDDAFSWIGGSAFHKVSGELRFDAASGNLSGDVNGDGKADFLIHLDGVSAAAALDGHFVF